MTRLPIIVGRSLGRTQATLLLEIGGVGNEIRCREGSPWTARGEGSDVAAAGAVDSLFTLPPPQTSS